MPQFVCAHCHRVLEYSSDRPSFCGYCGKALPSDRVVATAEYSPDAVTLLPMAPTDELPPPPELVGGYRLLRQLGSGGMGSVYEAEEHATGRRVALKLIAPEFAASKDAVERFRQEGRLASGIAHPRCVFVLAADEDAGRPYIVMELMPGSTLKDLIEQQGPLPPEQAIPKILDVIDGLQEAHQLGVVHRDIKPSNCFLEADGRVKIGDFGLSKSLVNESHLTRTGTFLGTPLFASPEQVKGQPVDAQSDVYSVAATLYLLLTGRAPFQSGDTAATLARIVSDDPPSMRTLNDKLPLALDHVVLRGLGRQRERRYRDLAGFRQALLPFVPGQLSIGAMGLRFAAMAIDNIILLIGWQLFALLAFFPTRNFERLIIPTVNDAVRTTAITSLLWMVYFGISEGIWGCSLGKHALGLRVRTVIGTESPSFLRSFFRAVVFVTVLDVMGWVIAAIAWSVVPGTMTMDLLSYLNPGLWLTWTLVPTVGIVIPILVLLAPMRARNGYRGLHEFLSGTRVVRLPERPWRPSFVIRPLDELLVKPVGMPASVGPFTVRGALLWTAADRILLADDPALGRPVWLWLRPVTDPALSPRRRELARTTRLRWVACGREGDLQWDAFLFPPGCPIPEVLATGKRLPWTDARPILEDLTDELVTASADGTLPEQLTMDQVWVQPNGRVVLMDTTPRVPGEETPVEESAAVRTLLCQVLKSVLEGQLYPPVGATGPVQAPLPLHARKLVNRLLGEGPPFADLREFQAALGTTRDQPTEVTWSRRLAHISLLIMLMGFSFLAGMVNMAFLISTGSISPTIQDNLKGKALLRQLEVIAVAEVTAAAAEPEPLVRAYFCNQAEQDRQLRELLRQKLEQNQHWLALRKSSGVLSGFYVQMMETYLQGESDEEQTAGWNPRPRLEAQIIIYRRLDRPNLLAALMIVAAVGIGMCPVLWMLWAFAWRGGVSHRLMGMALVRSNGKPAWRLQCAWRALLTWLPVAALLYLSTSLEVWYWLHWSEADPFWGVRLAATVVFWLAIGQLLLYGLLALWSPARGLHDRLAGTYLVPK